MSLICHTRGTARPARLHQAQGMAQIARPVSSLNAIHRQEVVLAAAELESPSSRRVLLGGLLAGCAALTITPAQPASAYASKELCVDKQTEEEDTACRREVLARTNQGQDYSSVSARKFELAPNVPVSALNDEYFQATLKISDEIETYCTMDVYNKQRVPLIKTLKADGTTWVSKYARGGSARTQSARRMYIAVDSVVGHLASNGLAPLPPVKVKAVLKSVNEAKEFLAKGI